MSFSYNVSGLDRLPFYLDGSMRGSAEYSEQLNSFETAGTRSCIDWYGEFMDCPGPALESKVWTISPSSVPVTPSADYYALHMYFLGPTLAGEGCHDPIAPTDAPCFGSPSDSHYDGSFDVGGWAIQAGDTYQLVDPVFEADSNYPPEHNGNSQVNWPVDEHHGTHAYLVNPSPVWPVPDVVGNEFGVCLFDSLGALPGSITANIQHFNKWQRVGALWYMAISAYELRGPPPVVGEGTHGCIIHYA